MSDSTEPVVVEAPVPEVTPTPVLSVREHAEEFRTNGQPSKAAPEGETAEEKAERLQNRGKDGTFAEGHKKVRPSKDVAARIGKAHEKVATAEERATAAETRAVNAERELATLRTQRAAPAQIEAAERRVEVAGGDAAASDPEPTEDDPKFGGDYGKFLQAQARWAARDERRQERANEAKERQVAERRDAEINTWKSFDGRIKQAEAKYEDFQAVALAQPVPWTVGSAIDAFILDDDNGPDVLYHLQSHLEERDEILKMPVLKQLKRLSLLSQTFDDQPSSSASGSARATGAVTTRPETLPKPPTPVRTEARRVVEPPPTDGSLGILAHAKKFQPTR